MSIYSIAIDGPSGAGKSTLARALAAKLGYLYVDTGAIYRTVGLAAKRAGIGLDNAAAVIDLLPGLDIDLGYGEDGIQRMYLAGEDVSAAIREPEISMYASAVSALPEVRAFLMEQQRSLARTHCVIMDGRDIGTVVLPDADLKIFLTASVEERARRRHKELLEKGQNIPFDTVKEEIAQRDYVDSHREVAPLKQAEDAVVADTSGLNLEESLVLLLTIVKERLKI